MKNLLFLALLLGLSGCGDGNQDYTSGVSNTLTSTDVKNEPLILTSHNRLINSPKAFSAASVASSLGDWSVTNPTAVKASILYDGSKGAVTSSTLITPNASQVAKVLRGGAAGYALSFAVEQLLGAVDWVLDPANNTIKYPSPVEIATWKVAGTLFPDMTIEQACKAARSGYLRHTSTQCVYGSIGANGQENTSAYWGYEIVGSPSTEEKSIPLDVIAQKVIENAESDNLDAQFAILAAAQDILAEAEQDDEKAQPIVNDLELNSNNTCDPSTNINCKQECDPPAGVKFNKVTHFERHGRDPDPNAGSHGCMEKTGSPVHWHYDVNNQLPDGRCIIRGHIFGGCGVAQ